MKTIFTCVFLGVSTMSVFSDNGLMSEWRIFSEKMGLSGKGSLAPRKQFFDERISKMSISTKRNPDYYSSLDNSIKKYVVSSITLEAIEKNDFVTLQFCLKHYPQQFLWNQKTWYALCSKDKGVMFYALFGACHDLDEKSENYKIINKIIKEAFPRVKFSDQKIKFLKEAKSAYQKISNLDKLLPNYSFISMNLSLSNYGIKDFIEYFEKREARLNELREAR